MQEDFNEQENKQEAYLGFSFNGIHSSSFGLIRTYSDRLEEKIGAQRKEISASAPGADGVYYWGSTQSKKDIPIEFVFQGMTEKELQDFKTHFTCKKIGQLILDEDPFISYPVKITGNTTIKTLAFEDEQGRYYNGEGSIIFTCYSLYSKNLYNFLEEYPMLEDLDVLYTNAQFENKELFPVVHEITKDTEEVSLVTVFKREITQETWRALNQLPVGKAYSNKYHFCKSLDETRNEYYNVFENIGEVPISFTFQFSSQEIKNDDDKEEVIYPSWINISLIHDQEKQGEIKIKLVNDKNGKFVIDSKDWSCKFNGKNKDYEGKMFQFPVGENKLIISTDQNISLFDLKIEYQYLYQI